MKLGEMRTTQEVCKERECQECGESATKKLTFLLEGSRQNPQSSAYGKDDCSWCEDGCAFSCDAHERNVERDPPRGMAWCSTFGKERFEHMFLYWEKTELKMSSIEKVEQPSSGASL